MIVFWVAPNNILFKHEFISLTQDADGVTAKIRNVSTDTTFDVRAKYLIAADGGRTIGKQLGVTLQGKQNLITQVSVHIEADLSQHYPDDRVLLNWLRSPLRPGVSVIVPMGPKHWGRHSPEWSFGFAKMPFDPEFNHENIIPLIRASLGIPDLDIKVRSISEWSVGGVLADHYQKGRVFLAGDAAHRHPPTTGLGLNTGIQDAHNLAWKLALVTSGKASAELLNTYETERRPVGAFNVEWALNAFFNHMLLDSAIVATHPGDITKTQSPEHVREAYQALFTDNPNGRMRRARLSKVFETQAIEFYARDVELGFHYEQGALIPDGSPAPARDPLGKKYIPTTRPGHRLPHAWIDHHGKTISTHDLVGNDETFVLLCRNESTQWVMAAAALREELGVHIKAVTVGSNLDAYDAEGHWADLSEISKSGAVLVRPDNIIAWRCTALTVDVISDLRCTMQVILGATS